MHENFQHHGEVLIRVSVNFDKRHIRLALKTLIQWSRMASAPVSRGLI